MSRNIFLLELNLFGHELFTFCCDFIDSDNWNPLTLKVKGIEIFIRLCNSTPGKSIQYK